MQVHGLRWETACLSVAGKLLGEGGVRHVASEYQVVMQWDFSKVTCLH